MQNPRIICYGELLWDLLPQGKLAGGAPFNVAFHSNQLGIPALMISRLGKDKLGEDLLKVVQAKGMNTSLIQTDNKYPTGIVEVEVDIKGSPSYKIAKNSAWDYIENNSFLLDIVKGSDALIFGSLASRNKKSRDTLEELLRQSTFRVFDLNLRSPFYTATLVEKLLHHTDVLKLSHDELNTVALWYGLDNTEESVLSFLKNTFDIEILLLTKGSKGAVCFDDSGFTNHPGFSLEVTDTVGSGDAFLAGFISAFLLGKPSNICLEFGNAMGALVATKKGATPEISLKEREFFLSNRVSSLPG